MHKRTIKYVDYNNETREEDFYFNISKAELAELAMSVNGGLENYLIKIAQEKDNEKIMKMLKKIILMAYGEKSLDGKMFMKSEEISNNFSHTEAFSELFMSLIQSEEEMTKFINAIIPELPEKEKRLAEQKVNQMIHHQS